MPVPTTPWQMAVKFEQFVHNYINRKDFSQAFASAVEVADTREGDCTEHAVLLAALCRARGIPARTAIGLVYVPHDQGFGYHMWTEVYINNSPLPSGATTDVVPEGPGKAESVKSPLPLGEGTG